MNTTRRSGKCAWCGMLGMCAVLGLVATTPGTAHANSVLNGGFELPPPNGSFSDWATTGNDSIQTAAIGVTPTNGTHQAFLDDGGAPNEAALDSFLGAAPLTLQHLGEAAGFLNASIPNGSAISQSFAVNAGDVVTLKYDFATNQGDTPYGRDFAFVTIVGAVNYAQILADTSSGMVASPPSGFALHTGYRTFTYTFSSAGSYQLGLGVVDVGISGSPSAVLFDSISTNTVSAVPLPSAAWGGLGLLACMSLVKFARRDAGLQIL